MYEAGSKARSRAELDILKGHPSDIFPSARLYVLKVPLPPSAVPLAGNGLCKYMSLWGTLFIQTTLETDGVFGPSQSQVGHWGLKRAASKPQFLTAKDRIILLTVSF